MKNKKNNVISFPTDISENEREIEAILFAADEPLDVQTIESKINKKRNVLKRFVQEEFSLKEGFDQREEIILRKISPHAQIDS